MQKHWLFAGVVAAVLSVAAIGILNAKEKEKEKEETEAQVKLADCPAAVQQTLQKEAEGAKIETVDKETEDGKTCYEADATINGKDYEIKVAEDGTLVQKKLEDDDGGVKVNFADLPAAVQKGLQDQAKGAKLDQIEKKTEDGKTVYEVETTVDGKKQEIKVSEDGKLVPKDKEEKDEKEGKGEKDEKGEH